jgi:hypothetical protein
LHTGELGDNARRDRDEVHASDLAPADVTQDNVEGSATSFAVDVGGLWKFGPAVDLGLAFTNMGPTHVHRPRTSDPLPWTMLASARRGRASRGRHQ